MLFSSLLSVPYALTCRTRLTQIYLNLLFWICFLSLWSFLPSSAASKPFFRLSFSAKCLPLSHWEYLSAKHNPSFSHCFSIPYLLMIRKHYHCQDSDSFSYLASKKEPKGVPKWLGIRCSLEIGNLISLLVEVFPLDLPGLFYLQIPEFMD